MEDRNTHLIGREPEDEAGDERDVVAPAPGTRRVALRVAYDGAAYFGWQVQTRGGEELPSAQGTLEKALADLTGEKIRVHAAGRTDAGVHAYGQCVHFDMAARVPSSALTLALAQRLPPELAVWEARDVPPDFHSRRSAVRRTYRYLLALADKRVPPACLARRHVGYFRGLHDLDQLRRGAELFLGDHDFTHFRSTDCQGKSPMRTIDEMEVTILGEEIRRAFGLYPGQMAIEVRVSSRAFLMHQVRLMVGALMRLSRGKMTLDDLAALLRGEMRESSKGGVTPAPPRGLTLWWVDYGANGPI